MFDWGEALLTASQVLTKAFDEITNHEYSLPTCDTLRTTSVSHEPEVKSLATLCHNISSDTISLKLVFKNLNRLSSTRGHLLGAKYTI